MLTKATLVCRYQLILVPVKHQVSTGFSIGIALKTVSKHSRYCFSYNSSSISSIATLKGVHFLVFLLQFKVHTFTLSSKIQSTWRFHTSAMTETCTVVKFPASCRGLVKLLQLPGRPQTVIPLLPLPGPHGRFGMCQLHKHTDTACIPEDLLALANDHSLFLCSTQQLALEPRTWLFTASFPDQDNFGAHKKVISLCGFP